MKEIILKNIFILKPNEFTFEVRKDGLNVYMKPNIHFYIEQDDELFRPKPQSVEILEVVGMKEDNFLKPNGEGRIRAEKTFEGVGFIESILFCL